MSKTITVDLENMDYGTPQGYVIVTFPNRTKILNATFTVNWEAYGSAEDDRTWALYALASHPYEDGGNDSEWIWPIFGQSAKPVVERADNLRFRSNTQATGVYSAPFGSPHIIREVHEGVLAPGDYLAMWIECTSGDTGGITWEDTRASITLEYEECAKASAYEQRDWWNWD